MKEKSVKMRLKVISLEKVTDDKIQYLVRYGNDKFLLNIYKNDRIKEEDFENYKKFRVGDILITNSKISKIEKLNNPYEFDYKRYLNSNGIISTITSYSIRYEENKIGFLDSVIQGIKESVIEKLEGVFSKEDIGLYKSIIYGDKADLSGDIEEKFKKLGISHIISVSGSNIYSVVLIFTFLFDKVNTKTKNTILLIYIFIFMNISSFTPSVLRAGIMAIILLFVDNKKVGIYKRLFISFFILLIINPYNILNASFMLSYTATLSIILFNDLVYSYFETKLRVILGCKYKIQGNIKGGIFYVINSVIKVSSFTLSVYILLLPLQIIFFSSFNIISFLSNILILTISSFEQIIGTMLLFFSDVFILSDILVYANFALIKILTLMVNLLSKIAISEIPIPDLNIFSYLIYYLIILYYRFRGKINNFLALKSKKLYKFMKKKMWICTTCYILYIILVYVYIIFIESYMIFFNVGQGNLCLIKKNNKVVIIDIGSTSNNVAANAVNSFMKKKAITKVDDIFITHMHEDHINGLEGVIENVKVGEVCLFEFENESDVDVIKINDILKQKKIRKKEVEKGEKIEIGKIHINILSPKKNNIIEDNDIKNANSLVILIDISKKNYLFMGDATINTEKYIFEKDNISYDIKNKLGDISIIQIGHHGSKTSTSETMLNNISVKEAVISSKKEKYGHPSKEILELLKRYNIKVRVTEDEGALKYKI